MSAVQVYRDPYRWQSALLALGVHAAFAAFLMFGVRWQPHDAGQYAVELWQALPEPVEQHDVVEPPKPVAPPQEVVQPAPVTQKADIELRDKKVKKPVKPQPTVKELRQRKLLEEQRVLEAYAEQQREAARARVRAEVAAATAAEVGRYQDMIRSKIRHNIVMPPNVASGISVEFKVTLLPDGSVLDAVRLKSSGNTAYDEATERAIYKAQPLPMPTDPVLKKRFRELRLTIRPEDE
ncbi:MAG: cell envelope integrity protein TolA [Pseudomonadota bacterium]